MNTGKQVNMMIGLLFVFLVGTLLYWLWDSGFSVAGFDVSSRSHDAEERQIVKNAERGGALFALNCRNCHGRTGKGAAENISLPGATLNVEANRPSDPGDLLSRQNRIRDTILCGRVGTLMPTWAEENGGPLNDFQIEQLVTLITGSMPGLDPPEDPNAISELGWEAVLEAADHTDILPGKLLARAVGPEDTVLVLTDAQGLHPDSLLRIDDEVLNIVDAPASSALSDDINADQTDLPVDMAADLFASGDVVQIDSEQMRVVSASDDTLTVERGVDDTQAKKHRVQANVFEPSDQILVERGAFTTQAAEHKEGTQLFNGPLLPPTGPVTGVDGTPPCGQRPPTVSTPTPTASPSPAASPTPIPVQGEVTMEIGDNFFQLDGQNNPTLQVAVGQEVTINLTNNGQATHNMHIAGVDNKYDVDVCKVGGDEPCSDPAAITAGATAKITFSFDQTGTFDYRCDFHPTQMTGQIVVTQ
jgi:plastocyanin/mono/diheme cytochrome c family protein